MKSNMQTVKSQESGKSYLFEILLSGVFVVTAAVLVSVLFGYSYSSNDDVMIKNIINGTYSGQPDAHLIYILYPAGLFLKFLYTLIPAIEWYDLLSVLLHYVCWFLLIIAAGSLGKTKKEKLAGEAVTFFLLIFVDFSYLIMEHYTVLAGLLAGTAIVYYLIVKDGNKYADIQRCVVIVCMLICLLLRRQVFILSLPIGGIIFLYRILKEADKDEKIKELKKSVLMIGIIVMFSLLFMGWDFGAYRSPEWKEFRAYNKARTDAYDYYLIGNYQLFEDEYKEMGLTGSDYEVLVDYNPQLIPGMNAGLMKKITDLGKAQWKTDKTFKRRTKEALRDVYLTLIAQLKEPVGILVLLAFTQALVNLIVKRDWKTGVMQLLLLGYLLGIMLIFFYKKRFPDHIAYLLYFMILSALCGMEAGNHNVEGLLKKESLKNIFILSTLFAVVFLSGFRIGLSVRTFNRTKERIEDWKYVNEYCRNHSENTYYLSTTSFLFTTEAIGAKRGLEADNILRLGTWTEDSPLQFARMERLGIESPFTSFYEQDNVYLIISKEKQIEWIETLYGERETEIKTFTEDEIVTPYGKEFRIVGIREAGQNKESDVGEE